MTAMGDPNIQALMQVLHQEIVQPPAPAQPPGQVGAALNAAPPVMQQAEKVNQPNMPAPPQGADEQSAALIQGQQAQPV